jgi:hypothetical protein
MKIAAGRRYRVSFGARKKMKQGFFFYGVNGRGDHPVIDQRIQDARTVFSNLADSLMAGRDITSVRA